jgi:membrane protein implicated in regulation of membrane protease activity
MNRFTQLFLLVWFSLCGLLCAALIYAAAVGNVSWQNASFPVAFLLFVIFLVRFGAHLSRADHVVERLRELLDGFGT